MACGTGPAPKACTRHIRTSYERFQFELGHVDGKDVRAHHPASYNAAHSAAYPVVYRSGMGQGSSTHSITSTSGHRAAHKAQDHANDWQRTRETEDQMMNKKQQLKAVRTPMGAYAYRRPRRIAKGAMCTLLALASISVLSGCAFVTSVGQATGFVSEEGLEVKALNPSQVHASYAPLDANNPLAGGNNPVTYMETGLPHYDQFFLSVAQMNGTLTLAQETISMVSETLNSGVVDSVLSGQLLREIVGGRANLTDGERRQLFTAILTGNLAGAQRLAPNLTQPRLEAIRTDMLNAHENIRPLQAYLPASVDSLTALPNQVTALTSSGQQLVTSAPNDFTGDRMRQLPRITQELGQAMNQLRTMPGTSREILGQLHALIP